MTVCIAGLFQWNYAKGGAPLDCGRAGILITDRMITAGDVQYEPRQRKVASIAQNVLIAIAGEFTVHSQALKDTLVQLRGNSQPHPYDVARIYGQAIQGLKRRQAEDLYLAPLGLNTDSFMAQHKEMSDSLTNALVNQLQSYRGEDVEAIVIGVSQQAGINIPAAQIYIVDNIGSVSCSDDVGFAAIGIGAWHACSRLMQNGYVNNWPFALALATLYAAKRAAEVAPGVGIATDIQLLLRDSIFPIWPQINQKLAEMYDEFNKSHEEIKRKAIEQLDQSLIKFASESAEYVETQGSLGENVSAHEGSNETAAEAARQDEDGTEGAKHS